MNGKVIIVLMKNINFFYLLIVVFLPFHSEAQNAEKVKLQLKWKHQFQFAGYYAAIEKGYYDEVGLEVELLEPTDGEDPNEAVVKGKAEFGVGTSSIVKMRAEGNKVVLLASVFQHSPQVLISVKRSKIRYAQDLVGKKIALEPNAADIIAFLEDEGVSLDQCILYPHLYNTEALISGEIDAMSAYISDELYLLRKDSIEYTLISPSMGGIDFYGDILFTTEQLIANQPETVRHFREASLRGWKYAMNNPEEMIELIYSKYSQRHTIDHLRFEANEMKKLILPDVVEIGYSNNGRWAQILNIYKELNLLGDNAKNDGLFYAEYNKPASDIPWKVIGALLAVIILSTSIAYFFYSNTKKLGKEVAKRIEIEGELRDREKALKESNKTKDKFYSIIAHDLRGPFVAILGFTELVIGEYKEKNKQIANYLTIIKVTANQMLNLLNNLLNWANSQTGLLDYNPQVLNLSDLISSIVEISKLIGKQKEISISVDMSEKTILFADKIMITSVINNLIGNAVKFTPRGGNVSVNVEENEREVTISISDTGVGIKSDKLKDIFNDNKISPTLGTENEKGSGLGLMICKEFVNKNGGKIWTESEEGAGSHFVFTIPKNNI